MNKVDFEDLILKSFRRIKTEKQDLSVIFVDSLMGRQAKFFSGDDYFILDCDEVAKSFDDYPQMTEKEMSDVIVANILNKMKLMSFKPFTEEELQKAFTEILSEYEGSSFEIKDGKISMTINGQKMAMLIVVINQGLKNHFSKDDMIKELADLIRKKVTSQPSPLAS